MLELIKNTLKKLFKTSRQSFLSICWLAIILFAGFYTLKGHDSLSQTFPSCSTLASGTANTPDDSNPGFNCHYLGLPPCKTFVGTKKHRENCADIIDLPLCSTIVPASNVASGVNCVKLASEITDPDSSAVPRKVRGVDYAVNNKDSIRFCGQVETNLCDTNGGTDKCNISEMSMNTTASGGDNNCTKIKCHQMTASQTPDKNSNCNIINCNLLTLEEIKVSDNRFANDSKQYCDGSNVKCYDFFSNSSTSEANTETNNSDNLKYIMYRYNNPLCQIHNCKPDSPSCGADDTLVFDSTSPLYKGDAYKADYSQYINGGMPIEGGLCKPLNCKPIGIRQYVCSFFDCNNAANSSKPECLNPNAPPSNPNNNCDCSVPCPTCAAKNGCPAGFTRECTEGYCNKKIDCNIAANAKEPECVVSSPESPDTDSDLFNAWFYRPTPPDRVVNDSSGLVKSDIKEKIIDDFCYSVGEVRDMGWGRTDTIGICSISCDKYFWHYGTGPTRSPELCDTSHLGNRAIGYFGLHGVEMNIFKNPDNDVGYIKGVAGANYELTQPEYRIKSCLRYTNTFNLTGATGTLSGKRDCRFDISDGPYSSPVKTQRCGYDVCREMKISNEDIDRCSMKLHNDIFDSDNSPDCVSSTIDTYVRMRMRKYGRFICVFVDHKGAVAYNNKNFNGSETITDKSLCSDNVKPVNGNCANGYKTYCVDGEKDAEGKCQGKNTNDEKGLADKWRTVKMVKYIGNNRSGSKPGYVSMEGQFFPEQDCAKIPLRIGPARFYNVATIANSKTLFEPPLFILNVRKIRGGAISEPILGQQFGSTDFYQPEIVVQYGAQQQRMSLSNGYLGKDSSVEDYPASPWAKIITTSINSLEHQADAFVQKEYNSNLSQPLLCLYRNAVDQFGAPVNPIKLGCVKRNKPTLRSDVIGDSSAKMRVLIRPDTSNIFNSAKLKFQLIEDYGANNANNSCTSDDICSKEVVFENTNADIESCSSEIERYKFCSKRDVCSKLLYECINNEVAINNSLALGQPTGQLEAIKQDCNTTILSSCNEKFGINDNDAPDFLSQINNGAVADMNYQNFQSLFNNATKTKIDPTRYGWFNEICITKGFEDSLKRVIAYKTKNGILGKCQIDTVKSLYLNDSNASTNCNAGGKAPYCVCSEFVDGTVLPSDQEARLETNREAGLCLDIPLPKFCTAIDHTTNDSPDDYVASSIANSHTNSSYNDNTGVHTSHQSRTLDAIDSHHAEYSSILGGSNNVAGFCKGFWKEQTNSQNTTLLPKMNCKINGQWEKIPGNDCERYSCPEIYTEFSNYTNSYTNRYADADTAGNEGLSHGYALWHKVTKTTDFLGSYESAYQCITGFKINSSGQLPKRHCNQIGVWDPIAFNPCERITCPAQFAGDGILSSNPTTQAQIDAWVNNGGAEFPQTNASRSNAAITPGSTAYGTCKNSLGFFKLTSSSSPTRTCDYLGNWSTSVNNPCVTLDCNAIGLEASRQDNNGFALWPKTTNVPAVVGGFLDVKATSCATKGATPDPAIDWVPNPYAPIDSSTGQPSLPTRKCSSVQIDNGWATVWNVPVDNKCIDKCQGADLDPINGVTTQNSSTGPKTINWESAAFGQYAYFDGPCSNMNASLFTQGRTNGCYRLRRLCGNGSNGYKKGQWGPVEPMCVANGGQNGNATYYADSNPATTGSADSMVVNGSKSTGTCASGYSVKSPTPLPVRQCVYGDVAKNIDKVYLNLVDGTQDCQKLCVTPTSETSFGSGSKYTGTAGITKFPGETINLVCKSNYGGKVGGTGGDSKCGRNASDRSSTAPSVKCMNDGTWDTAIENDCTECRSCSNLGAPSIPPFASGSDFDCKGNYGCKGFTRDQKFSLNDCCGGMGVYIDITSMPHNTSRSGSRTRDGDCNRDAHGRFTVTCTDGQYTVSQNCD